MNAEERRNGNVNSRPTTDFADFGRRNDTDTATATAKRFVRTHRKKIAALTGSVPRVVLLPFQRLL